VHLLRTSAHVLEQQSASSEQAAPSAPHEAVGFNGVNEGSALGSKLGCSDGLVLGSELGLQVFPDFAFAPRQSSSSLDLETFLPPLVAALGFLLGFLLPLARATAVTAWFAVFLYSNTLALMGTSPSRPTIAIFNIFILWYQVVVSCK
jgi:hypothetical protein